MRKASHGLTLFELINTLALIGILSVIGIPNLKPILDKNKANSQAHTLFRTFQLARSEALNRNQDILLCGTNNGNRCSRYWHEALVVFVDKDDNKQPSNDEIIFSKQLSAAPGEIKTRVVFGRPYVKISKRGFAAAAGSFIICSQDAKFHRRVTWNRSGRPYLGQDRNNDGFTDDTNGKPLKC